MPLFFENFKAWNVLAGNHNFFDKHMKTKSIIVCLIILSCHYSYGQKNDLKRMSLKGNVKSIKEYNYQTVEKGGEITDGQLQFYYQNTFNNKGNKIADVRFDPDGKVNKKYEYKYDSAGRRIEQNQYTINGSLIRKIIYTYDAKGNLTEDNSYDPDGKFDKKYTYTYDDTGNVTEDNSYDTGNNLLKKITYKYDNAGNKTESSRFSARGDLEKKFIYKYDRKGNMVEETDRSSDGTRVTYQYTYEFDRNENWTKKITSNDDKPVNVIVREIEYYQQ